MDHAALESFVRETLGCGCPAEVLRDIRVEPPSDIHDGALWVGGRLLVFLLRTHPADRFRSRFPALLEGGRARRDGEGFNRVRYVVFGDDPALFGEARAGFDRVLAGDTHAHLHCLAPEAFPL